MRRTRATAIVPLLAAILVAGCEGHRAAEPSPLIASGAVATGGAGVLGLGATATAHYTPKGNFGLAFVIQNRSDEPVTIVGLSSGDEHGTRFADLVGVSAARYVPIDCAGHSCPATDLGLGGPPYRPLPALAPLTIPPGGRASVQLHFRWVPCAVAPRQSADSENATLLVDYQSGGRDSTQLLETGAARLEVSSSRACLGQVSS
jgi:hypothetical protein